MKAKLRDKWNLSLLNINSDNDPQIEVQLKEIHENAYKFINKWKDRNDYLESPEILLEALDEYEEWTKNYGVDGNVGYYFSLRSSQDSDNPEIKARLNKLTDFSTKIDNDAKFFYHRVSKIPENQQAKFLNYKPLEKYRYFLTTMFLESKYLLSEQEEKIVSLLAPTSFSNWIRMTSTFLSKEEAIVIDEDGKKSKKTDAELGALLSSTNKATRDSAAQAINNIAKKHLETGENELNSILQYKKIMDELKGFKRPDEARHINDGIETEVVDKLISSVSKRYSISARYYELKAKLLGVDKLEYHERNVPYGESAKSYSFEEAFNLVDKVFKKLDPEFSKIFNDFYKEGNFDIYPAKGKQSGAFCIHGTTIQPIYVFLNHTNKLNDVLTLAHEMGHAINDEFMRKAQNELNFGTSLATAEVASTFMEDFVLQELLSDADDETRLSILIDKLNDDVSTIFRQIACYQFEQELHKSFREKGYLPASDVGEIFQKHMKAYMGDFVKYTDDSKNWWLHWPHIRVFFYVYSYASGLLISKSLQNSIKQNPKRIEDVKTLLSAGLSDSPRNIFSKVGVDITDESFWDAGLKEVEDLLAETEQLAKKLGKIK